MLDNNLHIFFEIALLGIGMFITLKYFIKYYSIFIRIRRTVNNNHKLNLLKAMIMHSHFSLVPFSSWHTQTRRKKDFHIFGHLLLWQMVHFTQSIGQMVSSHSVKRDERYSSKELSYCSKMLHTLPGLESRSLGWKPLDYSGLSIRFWILLPLIAVKLRNSFFSIIFEYNFKGDYQNFNTKIYAQVSNPCIAETYTTYTFVRIEFYYVLSKAPNVWGNVICYVSNFWYRVYNIIWRQNILY